MDRQTDRHWQTGVTVGQTDSCLRQTDRQTDRKTVTDRLRLGEPERERGENCKIPAVSVRWAGPD